MNSVLYSVQWRSVPNIQPMMYPIKQILIFRGIQYNPDIIYIHLYSSLSLYIYIYIHIYISDRPAERRIGGLITTENNTIKPVTKEAVHTNKTYLPEKLLFVMAHWKLSTICIDRTSDHLHFQPVLLIHGTRTSQCAKQTPLTAWYIESAGLYIFYNTVNTSALRYKYMVFLRQLSPWLNCWIRSKYLVRNNCDSDSEWIIVVFAIMLQG